MTVKSWIVASSFVLAMTMHTAYAQSPTLLSKDQPIELSADSLEVLQNNHTAIFTGNVIVTQGAIHMNAAQMTVYYRESGSTGQMGKGIYKIAAEGKVIFTTPAETATGDNAIYDVDNDTIHLMGNVLLTRDKNVLKGTKLDYNLKTGRSVLVGGASVGGGRVHGLFMPDSAKGTK
jgi:lipopolysaccharide export system protein LptA